MQSVSKVYTLAAVMDKLGPIFVDEKIGTRATGRKFNSIVAIEEMQDKPSNSLVNAGAIATTSLMSGENYDEKLESILQTMRDFSGRKEITVNQAVYESEKATSQRNQAIATLLASYGRIYFDPLQSTDLYIKQCSINMNLKDLAVMGATLANNGVNPITKKQVVKSEVIPHVLAVMATAGMYDDSGSWLFRVGLPAKSGVGGGIVAVMPGKLAIAAFSPRLNDVGNSVRGEKAIQLVANQLALSVLS
eukprot:GHVN01040401.1.p1 GENE.GHVN01040401.1~~GHVN01040401.1.p1  ORF type:complete len:248 (-),score=38.39 GHVN01040401.1:108-851(-)